MGKGQVLIKDMNYFPTKELRCKCPCHIHNVGEDLVRKANFVREDYGKPLIITSGCRCPSHNKRVGGSKTSSHRTKVKKKCTALDIKFPKNWEDMFKLLTLLPVHFKRIGINVRKRFIHVDIDKSKNSPRWWFYKV